MSNIIHVDFAKRHAKKKASQRFETLNKKLEPNETFGSFLIGCGFGMLVLLGIAAIFAK